MTEKLPQNRKKTGFRGPSPDVGKNTRFKPGISGNPGGRPRKGVLSEALKEMLTEKADDPVCEALHLAKGSTWMEVFKVKMRREIIAGKTPIAAMKELMDRTEGKSIARVEVAGPEGGPIEIDEIRLRLLGKLLPDKLSKK
jgi:Family of unknown function (DUF5681)